MQGVLWIVAIKKEKEKKKDKRTDVGFSSRQQGVPHCWPTWIAFFWNLYIASHFLFVCEPARLKDVGMCACFILSRNFLRQ